jgi:cation-transporting P-type ATPase C
VGNQAFLESEGVALPRLSPKTREHIDSGHTLLFVAINKRVQGSIAVANRLRPGVKEVVAELHAQGRTCLYLISGDTEPSVRTIASALDLDGYRAALLPEEKARFIERLERSGKKVVMVGDGVNDALALSKATLGVAMGAGGSEVAIEAADIALVKDDLRGLLVVERLSRKTLATIEENFWIATGTNILGIMLGAAGLLSPVMAGFFHLGHTLGILLNSGRLVRWNPKNSNEIAWTRS